MGLNSSKQSQSQFMQEYEIIQQNREQNLQYIQHKVTNQQYLLKQMSANDIKQCHRILDKLADLKVKLSDNKHVLEIKQFQMSSTEQYCGMFYKIYVLAQYPHRTLDDEIRERSIVRKRFLEVELWSILASCVSGLAHMQRNSIQHGCLKSNRIMLTPEGMIKMADPWLTNTSSNYQTVLRRNPTNKHIYISPQQSRCLQQQLVIPDYNTYKSDVFTLGMIVLEAGLLSYQDEECYRDLGFRINWDGIKSNLQRFSTIYSDEIVSMLKFMLTKEQNQRPDWLFLQGRYIEAGSGVKQATYQQSLKRQQSSSSVSESQTFSIKSNMKRIPFQSRGDILSNQNLRSNGQIITNVSPPRASFESHQGTASFGQPYLRFGMPPMTFGSQVSSLPAVTQQPILQSNNSQTMLSRKTSERSLRSRQSQPVQSHPFYRSQNQSHSQSQHGVPSSYSVGLPLSGRQSQHKISVNSVPLVFPPPPLLQPSTPIIKTSNIQLTRPLLNIFPSPAYQNQTHIDDNIVIVHPDGKIQSEKSGFKDNRMQLLRQVKVTTTTTEQKRYLAPPPSHLLPIQTQLPIQTTPILPANNQNENSLYKQLVNLTTQHRESSYSSPTQYKHYPRDSILSSSNTNSKLINTTTPNNTFTNSKTAPIGTSLKLEPFPEVLHHEPQLQYVVENYPQGSRYQGHKWKGMRHGEGKFYYEDGGYYSGMWKLNKMEGFGRLYYQSNRIAYEGNWKNDHFNGTGVLYNEQPQFIKEGLDYRDLSNLDQFWVKYEGELVNDEKQGYGKIYYSNGEIFQGLFKNDCIDGRGIYYCNNGVIVKGLWARDRKVQ